LLGLVVPGSVEVVEVGLVFCYGQNVQMDLVPVENVVPVAVAVEVCLVFLSGDCGGDASIVTMLLTDWLATFDQVGGGE